MGTRGELKVAGREYRVSNCTVLHCIPNFKQCVVFDLHPGKGVDVLACVDAVYLLKNVLARLQLLESEMPPEFA
jgi:DNA primase